MSHVGFGSSVPQGPVDEAEQVRSRARTAAILGVVSFPWMMILGPFALWSGVRTFRELGRLGETKRTASWVAMVFGGLATSVAVLLPVTLIVLMVFADPVVYVANGTAKSRTLTVDGTARGTIAGQSYLRIEVPEGRHAVCVKGEDDREAICETATFRDGSKTLVNPGRESRFAVVTVTYAVSTSDVPPPRTRLLPRASLHDVGGIHSVLRPLPETISLREGERREEEMLVWADPEPVLVVVAAGDAAGRIALDGAFYDIPSRGHRAFHLREGVHSLDLGDGTVVRRELADASSLLVDLEGTAAFPRCIAATAGRPRSTETLAPAKLHELDDVAAIFEEVTPRQTIFVEPVRAWIGVPDGDCRKPAALVEHMAANELVD